MIVIALALVGILLGIRAAARQDGASLDKLQYGASYGIAFALAGVVLTIVIERLAG